MSPETRTGAVSVDRRFGRRTPTYSALLWPGGIELIEYRSCRKATSVLRHVRRLSPFYSTDQAADRLAELVSRALSPPPPTRRPTRPSRSRREARLTSKTRRGGLKRLRQQPAEDA